MIKLAEELNDPKDIFRPPFYKFSCDGCGVILYIIPILFDNSLIKIMQQSINLCKDCYSEKTQDELSKIARLSSEIVIKDLAKMDIHSKILEDRKIKREDTNLEDLKKYLESKQLFQ